MSLDNLLDPTGEREAAERPRLARPTSLDGLTVGVLDISKARGDVFLEKVASLIEGRGIEVKRYRKPTVARTAPMAIQQAIVEEVDVVVEGLAD
ncbi:MAG: hypothetical protein HOK21_08585 [Rhodospirillaceae bacterium]|jgi:hypothetical protein|nr:hypothetical protein [Rhodospirillaceae bacterium]MBT4042800.1 hypothetical protein [Rhodospirillaceae bacterium]MBT4687260.1 hypothetical protein [Rhodospirillaceae bacterium]MBT5524127.1 hypothetical protein [Rhodospirillaceae bacterium]MBT5880804.1 hypothetical protein [Rhodospirillaceae bacterium]